MYEKNKTPPLQNIFKVQNGKEKIKSYHIKLMRNGEIDEVGQKIQNSSYKKYVLAMECTAW